MSFYTMCDIMDIGAVVEASNLGRYAIFIYDYYPGGIGFAARGYKMLDEIMNATLRIIEKCECKDGCPSCVGAVAQAYMRTVDAAARDQIPDKHSALIMLHAMMDLTDYVPPHANHLKRPAGPAKLPEFTPLPPRTQKKIHKNLRRAKRKDT